MKTVKYTTTALVVLTKVDLKQILSQWTSHELAECGICFTDEIAQVLDLLRQEITKDDGEKSGLGLVALVQALVAERDNWKQYAEKYLNYEMDVRRQLNAERDRTDAALNERDREKARADAAERECDKYYKVAEEVLKVSGDTNLRLEKLLLKNRFYHKESK